MTLDNFPHLVKKCEALTMQLEFSCLLQSAKSAHSECHLVLVGRVLIPHLMRDAR
jgi:hypothetical protein